MVIEAIYLQDYGYGQDVYIAGDPGHRRLCVDYP